MGAGQLARDIDDFVCGDTPIDEPLLCDLASGNFLTRQRNAVLIGGTGTGKRQTPPFDTSGR